MHSACNKTKLTLETDQVCSNKTPHLLQPTHASDELWKMKLRWETLTLTMILSESREPTQYCMLPLWAQRDTTSWKYRWSGLGFPRLRMLLDVVSLKWSRQTITFTISFAVKLILQQSHNATVIKRGEIHYLVTLTWPIIIIIIF